MQTKARKLLHEVVFCNAVLRGASIGLLFAGLVVGFGLGLACLLGSCCLSSLRLFVCRFGLGYSFGFCVGSYQEPLPVGIEGLMWVSTAGSNRLRRYESAVVLPRFDDELLSYLLSAKLKGLCEFHLSCREFYTP